MNYARLLWQLYRKKQTMKKSKEQIQALQEKKLRKMLLYAYDHSAYYREAFETAGITADRIGTTPLDHFPTLNKELLMEHYDEIVTDPNIRQSELRSFGERSSDSMECYLEKYHVVHSSGSRCEDVTLRNVSFPNAAETLWSCDGVVLDQVTAKGDYFAMNSSNMKITGLTLYGNYSFDGARNVEIHNSRLLSKDAFWNSENVTVYDSFISGEYLGWNAKNLTLINCTVESLQGMCYIDNLVMKNCKLLNTTLAFEYSTVEADIIGKIDSVLNPSGGTIRADYIENLTIERDKVDPSKTNVICRQAEPLPVRKCG